MNSKNIFIFSIISFLFLSIGQFFFGRQGLLIGFFIASIFNLYFYFFSKSRTLRVLKCRKLIGQDIWNLQEVSLKISKSINAPNPSLYISDLKEPFILTVSNGWGQSHIIVTEALLNELSKLEIEDLLTLQILYSVSDLSLFMGSKMVLCEILFIFGQTLDFIISIPTLILSSKQPFVFFQKIMAPIVRLIQRGVHKKLLALDILTAKKIGSKERLARLLWKINSLNHSQPITTAPSCLLVYAVNPLTASGTNSYFQIHENLEMRILNLTGHKAI